MKRNTLRMFLLLMLAALLLAPSALAECDHPADQLEISENVMDPNYESVDATSHRVSGDLYEEIYCAKCDYFFWGDLIQKNYSELRKHGFEDNGLCWACGAKNTCTHPNTSTYSQWGDNSTCTALSSTEHVWRGDFYEGTYCTACEINLDIRLVEANYEEVNSHNFENSQCWNCDYVNTCTHPTKQTYTYLNNAVHTQLDKTHHTSTGDQYQGTECAECHEFLGETLIKKNFKEKNPHYFENGACYACGYVNTCKHPSNKQQTFPYIDKYEKYEITNSTATTHTSHGVLVEFVECMDCHEILSDTRTPNSTLVEDHIYENGACFYCGAKLTVTVKPTKVYLYDDGPLTINLGDSITLNYFFAPANASSDVKWSTSSKKVATVDENGVVTPIKEGSATITVKTANGKKDTVKVKVVDPYKPSKVVLAESGTVTLNMGETLTLNAALQPETAKSELKWTSSSKKIATVDENGVVTPVKEGTATITVKTHNGKKDTVKVKVVDPYKPSKVVLSESGTYTLNLGNVLILDYKLYPETARSELKWTSSNNKVATVDENGVIYSVKEGTATITVKTYNGKKDTLKVKVVDPFKATGIKAVSSKLTVTEGDTFTPEYKLTPITATSEVKITSSSKKILQVNADGTVTALKKGSAKLTLKTSTGKKATIKVTVKAKPASAKPDASYDEQTQMIVDEMRARLAAGQYETALYYMEQYCEDGKWTWITALFNEGLINEDFHAYLCEANSTYRSKFGGSKLPDQDDGKDDTQTKPQYTMENLREMAAADNFSILYDMYKNSVITEEQHLRLMEEFYDYYEFVKNGGVDVTPDEITIDYMLELYKTSDYAKMSKLIAEGKVPADVHQQMIEITGDNHYWSPVISGGDTDKDDSDSTGEYPMSELYKMCEIAIVEYAERGSYETWYEIGNAIVNGDITDEQVAILAETYGPNFTNRMDEMGIPY